jgi:hypothetical protein
MKTMSKKEEERAELHQLVLQGDIVEIKAWLYDHPYFKATESIFNEAMLSAVRSGTKKIVSILIPFVNCDEISVIDTDCEWLQDYVLKRGLAIDMSFNHKGYRRIITTRGEIRYLYESPY